MASSSLRLSRRLRSVRSAPRHAETEQAQAEQRERAGFGDAKRGEDVRMAFARSTVESIGQNLTKIVDVHTHLESHEGLQRITHANHVIKIVHRCAVPEEAKTLIE